MATVKGPTEQEIDAQASAFVAVVSRAVRDTLRVAADHVNSNSVDDLAMIQKAWNDKIDDKLLDHLSDSFHAGAVIQRANQHSGLIDILQDRNLTASGAVKIAFSWEDDFLGVTPVESPEFKIPLVQNPASNEMLANAKNRLVGVGNHVWQGARDQLVEGVQNGEGIRELKQRVRNSAQFSNYRAQLVARSEVSHAMNQGSLAQMRQLGLPTMVKTWLAINDSRTRPEHAEMDGQTASIDGDFSNGENPGDAPNCRCTIGYDLPDDDQADVDSLTGEQLSTEQSFVQKGCGCPNPVWNGSTDPTVSPCDCPPVLTPQELTELDALPNIQSATLQMSDCPAHEREALSAYQGLYYSGPVNWPTLNERLRAKDGDLEAAFAQEYNGEEYKKVVRNIDSAMARSPLRKDVTVYRGIRDGPSVFGSSWDESSMTGMEFTSHTYSSTTVNKHMAESFGGDSYDATNVMLHVNLKRGQRGVALCDHWDCPEDEILLPRGARFRVTKDLGMVGLQRVLEVEMIL